MAQPLLKRLLTIESQLQMQAAQPHPPNKPTDSSQPSHHILQPALQRAYRR
jgi:hypothetical protein